MKYQISISIGKSADKNSASTKAVKDCAHLLSLRGYKDYSLFFSENTSSITRYANIFKELLKFYFAMEKNAVVAVQYPMLNNVFKYFIAAARLKKIRFYCITHDIESLRLGGLQKALVEREVSNLNYYDCLVVHNDFMANWLRDRGTTAKLVPLGVFDYLLHKVPKNDHSSKTFNTIVFAGNLAKSNFIYSLSEVSNWQFNVYGPNYKKSSQQSPNVVWGGEFSPDEVVYQLQGNFGLIWDGERIDECDAVLGNYLKYNNPHKLSLYLAAGLPVIAPKSSAIGRLIAELNIGILVESLRELDKLEFDEPNYKLLQENCNKIQAEVVKGKFFLSAIDAVEGELNA